MKELDAEELESLMSVLTEREQILLLRRFGLEDTARIDRSDVARDFGISRGRVSQIENSALEKLQNETQRRGALFRSKLLNEKGAKIRVPR